MSRLQVGGLALNTQTGNIVVLKFFMDSDQLHDFNHNKLYDVWVVIDQNHKIKEYCVESKFLIPIGDAQAQNELRSEAESEPKDAVGDT